MALGIPHFRKPHMSQSQALAFVNDVPWILSFTASRCKFNGMQSHCKSQSSRATLAFSFQLQKCVYFLQLSAAFCSSGTCSWKGHWFLRTSSSPRRWAPWLLPAACAKLEVVLGSEVLGAPIPSFQYRQSLSEDMWMRFPATGMPPICRFFLRFTRCSLKDLRLSSKAGMPIRGTFSRC